MLEEAKLKFAEMMAAQINKMTANKKNQNELDRLYDKWKVNKKRKAFFLKNKNPSLLEQLNQIN